MTELLTIYRLEDLSMNYFVRGIFEPFPMITITDEFPKQILEIPTISVVNGKLSESEFEMGNRERGERIRMWFIDIFAINKSQRDDFAYKILTTIKNGITVYDYNEGFPPSASPTSINHLSVIKDT